MKKFLFGFSSQPNIQTITNWKYFMAKPSRCKISLTSFPWSSRNNASFKSRLVSKRQLDAIFWWSAGYPSIFLNALEDCYLENLFPGSDRSLWWLLPARDICETSMNRRKSWLQLIKQEILISLKILWRITKSYNFNTNIKIFCSFYFPR